MGELDEKVETENRFLKVFGTIGDLLALNLMWILCSIPIITIGASTTALFSVTMKMVRNEEGNIFSSFFDAFKANFKKATLCWIVIMVASAIICVELIYGVNTPGKLATGYLVLAMIEGIIFALTVPFVFPLTARFENTVWNTFKNSFLLAISNLGSWVKVFLIWFVPIYVCTRYVSVFFLIWYLWLMFVISVMAFLSSFTLRKLFDHIDRVKEKAEENKDVEKTVLGEIGLRDDRKAMEEKKERKKKISEKAHQNLKDI